MEDNELEDLISQFVADGLLIEHWDDNLKEKVYEVSPRAKEEAPELWEMHVKDLQRGLHRMWQKDFVEITFSDEGFIHDKILLTEKAYDPEELNKLSVDDRKYVSMLIQAFDTKF